MRVFFFSVIFASVAVQAEGDIDTTISNYNCLSYCVGSWGLCQKPSDDDFACYDKVDGECAPNTVECPNVAPRDDTTACQGCSAGSGPCIQPANWNYNNNVTDPQGNICRGQIDGVCPTGTLHCNSDAAVSFIEREASRQQPQVNLLQLSSQISTRNITAEVEAYVCNSYCVGLWGECQTAVQSDFNCYPADLGGRCINNLVKCPDVTAPNDPNVCSDCALDTQGPCMRPAVWNSGVNGTHALGSNVCDAYAHDGVCPAGTVHCNSTTFFLQRRTTHVTLQPLI